MSVARIVLSGQVIRSPEKRFTPSTNTAIGEVHFQFETIGKEGEPDFTPVKVISFGDDQVNKLVNEVKKGDSICVDGRLQINNYEVEGVRKREIEIVSNKVVNLTRAFGAGIVAEPPPATASTGSSPISKTANG